MIYSISTYITIISYNTTITINIYSRIIYGNTFPTMVILH